MQDFTICGNPGRTTRLSQLTYSYPTLDFLFENMENYEVIEWLIAGVHAEFSPMAILGKNCTMYKTYSG